MLLYVTLYVLDISLKPTLGYKTFAFVFYALLKCSHLAADS